MRPPREHFEAVEQPALRPAPTAPYDIPLWCDAKVARDQHAQVARGLYSLPTQYVGHTLRARADATTVRFYAGAVCIKVHARVPPGQRAFDTPRGHRLDSDVFPTYVLGHWAGGDPNDFLVP